MQTHQFKVKGLNQFKELIAQLHKRLHKQVRVVLLSGEMGAGKTEFARKWLQESGVKGRIKSPSYSIVESYQNTRIGTIHHMDLYRIADPYELIEIGIEEYLQDQLLVEWPERGWPKEINYDVWVEIEHQNENSRTLAVKTNKNIDGFKESLSDGL